MSVRRGGPLEVYLDDLVRLRKPHPCGSFEWKVVRLGADIGLRCHGCSRKVLLPRRELERRLKLFVSRGADYDLARQSESKECSTEIALETVESPEVVLS